MVKKWYLQQYRVVYKQFGWGIFLIMETAFIKNPSSQKLVSNVGVDGDALCKITKQNLFDTESRLAILFVNVLDWLSSI